MTPVPLPAPDEWNSAVEHSLANPTHILGPYEDDYGVIHVCCDGDGDPWERATAASPRSPGDRNADSNRGDEQQRPAMDKCARDQVLPHPSPLLSVPAYDYGSEGWAVTHLFELGPSDVAATNDEWYTPRWIFDAAGLVFDMDVCAPVAPEFRTCPARRYLTVLDDGLTAPWDGLVWMNPPYGNPAPWVDRFAGHSAGLALLPAANSRWRGRYVSAADGIAVLSVQKEASATSRGRCHAGFGRPDGSSVSYPVALILAARGGLALSALKRVATADPYAGGAWFVRPA